MERPRVLRLRRSLLILLFLPGCLVTRDDVYLTWQGDTGATMTVNYQTASRPDVPTVYFDTVSRGGNADAYLQQAQGAHSRIEGLRHGRFVSEVELTGLEPATTYFFVAGDEDGHTAEKTFRTLPADDTPLRFIAGGDVSILPRAGRLFSEAAKWNPMFVVIGGDLAYDSGNLKNAWMWDVWLNRWSHKMVTSEGHLIPMMLAPGNHEVNDDYSELERKAPFYFGYFAQGGKSYFSRRLGASTMLYVLDSGHVVNHDGEQAAWLQNELAGSAALPNQIAVYHVPLYPSFRTLEDRRSTEGRTHWLPLFDQFHLDVAFENHDHTHKRSKLLRAGEPDPNGTLYLGDGSMGVRPRPVETVPPYLEKASGTPHFWVVDIEGETLHYRAVNEAGDVFDEYPPAAEAAP